MVENTKKNQRAALSFKFKYKFGPSILGNNAGLVYKFKKIRGMTDFSDQFRKIIMRYKRIGYNLNVM